MDKTSILNQYRGICSDVLGELATKLNKSFKSFLMETLILYLRRFNSQMQFYFPKMQKIIEPVFYSSIFFLVFGLICIVSPSLFHY